MKVLTHYGCLLVLAVTPALAETKSTNNGKLIFPPGTAMSAKDRQTVEFAHIFYERPTNTISIPGEEGKHEPQITQDIETLLYEAELLRAMGSYPEYEFNSSTIGYGEKYPNNDVIPDHGGGVSPTASGLWAYVWAGPHQDHIWQNIQIKMGGKYHVWVRYQDVFSRPQPFTIKIEQHAGQPISHTFDKDKDKHERLAAGVVWHKFETPNLNPGQARLEVIKPADESSEAAPRFIDQIMITNDLNYIPLGPTQLNWQRVQKNIERLDVSGEEFVVWSANPWDNYSNKDWPESKSQLNPRLSMRTCIGEREQLLYMVTNTSAVPISLNIKAQLRSPSKSNAVKASTVAIIKSKRFGWVPDPLIPYDKLGRVELAPYHTVGLWVEVDTNNLAAGMYRGNLTLTGPITKSLDFKLKVLPTRLAKELDINTFVWLADHMWAENEDKVKFIAEHGINSATCQPSVKSTPIWRKYRMKLMVGGYIRQGFIDAGMNYDEWATYLSDEPGDTQWHTRAEEANKHLAADPKTPIMTNPTWNKHASLPTVLGLAPYADYWVPYIGHLYDEQVMAAMRNTGKPIFFYKCDGFLSKNPALCYNYFRKFPWVSYYHKIDGCGFWSVSQIRYHPWYDFDRPGYDGSGTDPAIVYPDEKGYYATRNIEGFREGTEDYKYLMFLRNKMDEKILRGIAKRFLASTTPGQVSAIREELLDLIELVQ